MGKTVPAQKALLVPVPWEECKAETLRALCRDFGAPSSARTIEAMRQFLQAVQSEGLENARINAQATAEQHPSSRRAGNKRKDASNNDETAGSADEAGESVSVVTGRRAKRPRTQGSTTQADSEPDSASRLPRQRAASITAEEDAEPVPPRTRGRARQAGEDKEKEDAPARRPRPRPAARRAPSPGVQTRTRGRAPEVREEGAKRERKPSARATEAAIAAKAAAKAAAPKRPRARRGPRRKAGDETEDDDETEDEEAGGVFDGVVLKPFFKPSSSQHAPRASSPAVPPPPSDPPATDDGSAPAEPEALIPGVAPLLPVTPDEPATPPHMPPSPRKPKPGSFTALGASTDNSSVGDAEPGADAGNDHDEEADAEGDDDDGAYAPVDVSPGASEEPQQRGSVTTEVVEVTEEIEIRVSPEFAERLLKADGEAKDEDEAEAEGAEGATVEPVAEDSVGPNDVDMSHHTVATTTESAADYTTPHSADAVTPDSPDEVIESLQQSAGASIAPETPALGTAEYVPTPLHQAVVHEYGFAGGLATPTGSAGIGTPGPAYPEAMQL